MTDEHPPTLARAKAAGIAWAVGSLAAGVVVGILGAFVQAQRTLLEFVSSAPSIPWGAVLTLVCLVAGIRGATWGMGTRWGGWLLLLGWIAGSVALGVESASGDLAISGGGRQVAYLFGGVIVGSAAATLPLPRGHGQERKSRGTPAAASASEPSDGATIDEPAGEMPREPMTGPGGATTR